MNKSSRHHPDTIQSSRNRTMCVCVLQSPHLILSQRWLHTVYVHSGHSQQLHLLWHCIQLLDELLQVWTEHLEQQHSWLYHMMPRYASKVKRCKTLYRAFHIAYFSWPWDNLAPFHTHIVNLSPGQYNSHSCTWMCCIRETLCSWFSWLLGGVRPDSCTAKASTSLRPDRLSPPPTGSTQAPDLLLTASESRWSAGDGKEMDFRIFEMSFL